MSFEQIAGAPFKPGFGLSGAFDHAESGGQTSHERRRVAEPFNGTPLEVGAPSFAHFAKGGRQTDGTMGFVFYATRTGNEIFFHPSFTRTGPDSSRK